MSSIPDSPTKDAHPRSRTSSLVSQFPPPVKPNAHPYAIKTTSTGLLSRSNSSPQHSSTYQHYIPPPSPSPTSSTPESPTKRSSRQYPALNGHRYSRSMADAPPRSLPRPPGMDSRPSSVSPRKTAHLHLDPEDNTPRQRREPDGNFRDMQLPEDPKTWDALQLATYLSTMIAGDSVRDIANFVCEHKITGRAFLRLTEKDLEEGGVDRWWGPTMLEASRSLRQSTLRGRIWGFRYTPESLPARTRSDSASSEDDDGEFRSNHTGRVKGMVASFESSSDGERSCSLSPNKNTLPQRSRIGDLFSPSEYEDGSTIKGHHIPQKELPRLLPFPLPPTLTPAHTGTAYMLPSSPDQELGYRPKSTGQRVPRLLPIPPVLVPSPGPSSALLHHPRPIRGGPPEIVAEPSMEELLAETAQAPSGWEMELGATVKHISADGDGAAGSFVIGRTGRRGRRVKPKAEGEDSARPTGDLFVRARRDVGSQTDEAVELARMEIELDAREGEVARRERDVVHRESQVESRVFAAIVERQTELQRMLQQAVESKACADARDVALLAREEIVEEREKEVEFRIGVIQKKEEDLLAQETTLNLALKLVKRVVGKVAVLVLGECAASLILTPLGIVVGSQRARGNASESPVRATRFFWPFVRNRGPYFVFLGLGVCAAFLRVLVRRVLLVGAVKVSGRVAGAGGRR